LVFQKFVIFRGASNTKKLLYLEENHTRRRVDFESNF